jgi:hypothetical protein
MPIAPTVVVTVRTSARALALIDKYFRSIGISYKSKSTICSESIKRFAEILEENTEFKMDSLENSLEYLDRMIESTQEIEKRAKLSIVKQLSKMDPLGIGDSTVNFSQAGKDFEDTL